MKKLFALLLLLAFALSLAACGGEPEDAEVITGADPDGNLVVEQPPENNAVISDTVNTPVAEYPVQTNLPTAPTQAPGTDPVPPAASTDPNNGGGTGTGDNGNGTGTGTGDNGTGEQERDPDDGYLTNNPTVTQWELDHGLDGWIINAENGVYFRVGPSSDYEIIRGLKNGTKILVVDQLTSGWCKVVHEGDVGYIYGKYVSLHDPAGTAETTPPATVTPGEDDPPVVVVP